MTQMKDRPGEEITEAAQEPESRASANDTLPVSIPAAPGGAHSPSDGIYRRGARVYREAGWPGVLPLPAGAKSPPPKGFTGHDGLWPTDEQIDEWVATRPADANLMLRVNYGLIGIDVDAYDAKTGGQTLKEAESRWGPLPPTWRSSSRAADVVSGIRVFRVPLGQAFQTVIEFKDRGLGDIEIVQPHHRYITTWPSFHPSGLQYRWYRPDGAQLPDGQVPRVDDLPELPSPWAEGLSRTVRDEAFDGSAPNRSSAQRERINEERYEKLLLLDDGRAPEPLVAARLEKAISDLTSGQGSRYDTTRDHVLALMRLQSIDRVGVPKALKELCPLYVMEVSNTRPQAVAMSEFLRFTAGAAALVAATPLFHGEHPGEVTDRDGQDGVGEDHPSWSRVDLGPLLSGDQDAPVPTLFERTDGVCLLYPGLVHSVHGEANRGSRSSFSSSACA